MSSLLIRNKIAVKFQSRTRKIYFIRHESYGNIQNHLIRDLAEPVHVIVITDSLKSSSSIHRKKERMFLADFIHCYIQKKN
jgi:hypothetical protein